MYISATSSYNYYGLFDTNAGTIENLTVNGYIDNAGSSSIYAGLIAGINWSSGVIRNCQSSLAPFNNYFARTEITDNGYIAWNFEIHANNSNAQVGGICGQNQGSIINCVNYADIFGKGDIGGIAGANHGGTITSCTNNGELNYWYQDTNRCVGGITGYFYNGAITNCKNQSPIKCVNASFSDETSIYPAIGQIIGRKVAGTNSGNSYGANPNYNQSYYADGYEGCFVSKGALREFKHGGFLGIGQSTHNQAMYVKNGEIGQIG